MTGSRGLNPPQVPTTFLAAHRKMALQVSEEHVDNSYFSIRITVDYPDPDVRGLGNPPGWRALGGFLECMEAARLNVDYSNEFNRLYASSCKEVAEELGLPVVDTWSIMQDAEVRKVDRVGHKFQFLPLE